MKTSSSSSASIALCFSGTFPCICDTYMCGERSTVQIKNRIKTILWFMGVWQLTSSSRARVLALWWPRPPGGKISSLQRIDAPGSGVWQFGLGHPRCSSSGRIRKRTKTRSLIRDRQLQIWNWEYVWLAFLSCLQARHILDRFCFALRLIQAQNKRAGYQLVASKTIHRTMVM